MGGGTAVNGSEDAIHFDANKQKFAESNIQYKEREQFFMVIQPENVDICFLGDSITQKFPWQDYYRAYTVANRGIGSDTTEGILSRLDSVIALNPKAIVILAGINDLAEGKTPAEIVQNFEKIIGELDSALPDTYFIISSIMPVTRQSKVSPGDILDTNSLLMEMCKRSDIPYIDIHKKMADENGYLKSEFAFDDVHLNVLGYQEYLSDIDALPIMKIIKPQ